MLKAKLIRIITTFSLILLASIFPSANAASDHQNGQIRLRWNPSNIYLNQNSYIEHEFTPTQTTSFTDGAAVRWANQYHFDFCWQGITGGRCGYVGFGLHSKNGANYFGNMDFSIYNTVAFQTIKSEANVTCRNDAERGYIGDTQTYQVTCWKGVVIQMGVPYILRVQWDPSNTPNDNNWWSATLINKNTNFSTTIGKIKAIGNLIDEPLLIYETVIYYAGDAVACDKVPIIDLRVFPPRSTTTSSKFLNQWNASCIRAKAFPSKEFPGYYSIRLGGENPEAREPNTSSNNTAGPTASPTLVKQKPLAPVFSGIKVSNSTLNINVNLNSSEPEIVYLVAPKLTGGLKQKIMGDLNGDVASWAIKFDSKSLTGSIPISFFSVKNGLTSSETKINYQIPGQSNSVQQIISVPAAPTSISSRLVGKELIVTAKVSTIGSAAASSVNLYSQALGISTDKSIKGDLLNNSVVFSIPVSSSDLSKKIDLNLVAINKVGSSRVAKGSYSLPVPKSPTVTKNDNAETVLCTKGQIIRTFASRSCPPGWENK